MQSKIIAFGIGLLIMAVFFSNSFKNDDFTIIAGPEYNSEDLYGNYTPASNQQDGMIMETYYVVTRDIKSLSLIDAKIPPGLFKNNNFLDIIMPAPIYIPGECSPCFVIFFENGEVKTKDDCYDPNEDKPHHIKGEVTKIFSLMARPLKSGAFDVLIELNGKKSWYTLHVRKELAI